MNNLWALVIGIERYAGDVVERATGAEVDVQRIYNWLREIGTPADNIVVLKNEEATRQIIIETFQGHLIDNPNIQDGDPLFIYFSGHGSRTAVPASWPSWNESEIEMIIPHDAVRDSATPSADMEVTGIPDRTLGSLIRKAARRHGRNITVVLDCCASGHGTRGAPRKPNARTCDASRVGRLTDDTDRHIWQDDAPLRPRVSFLRGAFVDRQDDSHVLLAACGRKEESNGTPLGGWFTTALLEAFRDPDLHPRSYSEIIKHVRRTFDGWYKDFQGLPEKERPEPQTPQCEGTNRDRVIFQNMIADSLDFAVQPTDGPRERCTIEAGAVRGVCPGTIFELRQYASNSYTPIASAVAVTVHPGHSIAILPSWMTIPQGVRAYISNFFSPLKFAVVNQSPHLQESNTTMDRLNRRIARMSTQAAMLCSQVPSPRDADIVFVVNENEVIFDRRDTRMSYLATTPPRVLSYNIDYIFPDVIAYISRFNFYLHQDNPLHPLINEVEVRLHRLGKPTTQDTANSLPKDFEEDEFMIPVEEIPFIEQEAIVQHQEDVSYGLVLHNYTKRPLFPYVLFFDPASYEIVNFYSPLNPDEPPLQPGGQLQLGSSSESLAAMSFVVNEDQVKDTGFLKVYLSTDPVKVNFMEQGPILNPQSTRGASEVETAQDPKPLPGLWDVITRKITVVLPE